MIFKKHEDHSKPSPEIFYGTFGVWHMDPHANSHKNKQHSNSNPQQMWFYMMPMMHEMWQDGEHKRHRGCHWRRHWQHGSCPQEMNPENFKEILHKMQEEQSKENSLPFPHRHGFCRRIFSDNKNKEQNSGPEHIYERQSLHTNIY